MGTRLITNVGKLPAVLGLFDRLEDEHSHSVFTVEQRQEA